MDEKENAEFGPEIFRMARQHLDGATFAWIAERESLSEPDVQQAWEQCRELLSSQIGSAGAILSDEEILEQSEQCVRLLLRWQESLELALLFPVLLDSQE